MSGTTLTLFATCAGGLHGPCPRFGPLPNTFGASRCECSCPCHTNGSGNTWTPSDADRFALYMVSEHGGMDPRVAAIIGDEPYTTLIEMGDLPSVAGTDTA